MTRKALALIALLALAACGDSGTGPSSIDGRYLLRTVDGSSMPISATLEGVIVTFESGFLQLNTDNSFTFTVTVSASANGQEITSSDTTVGTWVRNNNAIEFNFSDGSRDVGTINGNEISMTSDGVAFTFHK